MNESQEDQIPKYIRRPREEMIEIEINGQPGTFERPEEE